MERRPNDISRTISRRRLLLAIGVAWLAGDLSGCAQCACRPRGGWFGRRGGMRSFSQAPPTLGTSTDAIWEAQKNNVDASMFVVYQHEFNEGVRLNTLGEDHLKQIAARLTQGASYPVIVERSKSSPRADTKHKYPVHVNPELDNQRREVVIKALVAMGIQDAEDRVIVSLPYSNGISSTQAENAYNKSASPTSRFGGGGFGGGFGGFGGGMIGGAGMF